MSIKEELQAKHDAIAAIQISETIGGIVSTAYLQSCIAEYCGSLQNYIDNLDVNMGLLAQGEGPKSSRADDICTEEEIPNAFDRWECVKLQIEAYGLTIPGGLGNPFDITQLRQILSALELIGDRLSECLSGCAHIIAENADTLDSQSIFKGVFGKLRLQYDPAATFASIDNDPEDPEAFIVTLNRRVFYNREGNAYDYQTTEDIIIHELGHVFHDRLPIAAETTFTIEGLEDVSGNEVGNRDYRIPANTPQVLVDFVEATNSYWSGAEIDFGYWYREDGFQGEDRGVVPLTNRLVRSQRYEAGCLCNHDEDKQGIRMNCDPAAVNDPNSKFFYYVDADGRCIKNANDIVYVREPMTYIPTLSYSSETDLSDFTNEVGRTSIPSPKEGFADTFKVHIRSDVGSLPSDEPRRQFFEDNFCCWVYQLLSDAYPELDDCAKKCQGD